MKAGDKLRFRGPAGAEFAVTVGEAFTPATIQRFIDSGEWVLQDLSSESMNPAIEAVTPTTDKPVRRQRRKA